MNQRQIKKLKAVIGYVDDCPEIKRHFKRLKKKYTRLHPKEREFFITHLEKLYDNKVNKPETTNDNE